MPAFVRVLRRPPSRQRAVDRAGSGPDSGRFGQSLPNATGAPAYSRRVFSAFLGITVDYKLTLGDAIVGAGTLLLAVFTGWLAWQTRREVKKTDQSIALARESIEAQDMPYVIVMPQDRSTIEITGPHDVPPRWLLKVRLWNIGRGPAIVGDIRIASEPDGAELVDYQWAQRPVAAGGKRDSALGFAGPSDDFEDAEGTLTLRVYYRHASGARYMTTSRLEVSGQEVLPVSFVRSFADDDERPRNSAQP
jgi:hypothetical protein